VPIVWFTDEHLRFATENLNDIPVQKFTPLSDANGEKVYLLDVTKLAAKWGKDDTCEGRSVYISLKIHITCDAWQSGNTQGNVAVAGHRIEETVTKDKSFQAPTSPLMRM
jgi:hypothetical protein